MRAVKTNWQVLKVALMCVLVGMQANGEPGKEGGAESAESAKEVPKKPEGDRGEEKPKEKAGQVMLSGSTQPFRYVAQTGTVPILKEDGGKKANIFYVYYAATDEDGKRLAAKNINRPIMFCFNGGPGASSVWLHLGGLGPKRVELPPDGLQPATVSRTVDNPYSALDAADLVFVDPVNTGLSRVAKGEKAEQFLGVEEDIRAVGEFVRLFTTREQRWNSPKYLCGESYGVLRVAGLASYMQSQHGWYPEGLVLVSGLVDYQTIFTGYGNDLPYALALPTLTATAHYHKKLDPELQANLEKAVEASRSFALGEYTSALMYGNGLPEKQKEKVAAQLARFTGLDEKEIQKLDLRIDVSYFRKALLKKEGKVIGRFDSRVTMADTAPAEIRPGADPSYGNIAGAFSSAINGYVRGDLGYESDHPYHILNMELGWSWGNYRNRYVSTADKLASAIQDNPKMRVLVMCARRDLAVPEDSMRYSLSHIPMAPESRANVRFSLYESGHMMYLLREDAEKLRADLKGFIR